MMSREEGPTYRPAFLMALVLPCLIYLSACGSQNYQQKARGILTKSYYATKQLEETFHSLDRKMQSAIVAGDDLQMILKQLSTHRQMRDEVQAAFASAYETIAFALLDPNEIRLIAVSKAHTIVSELFYAWAKGIK